MRGAFPCYHGANNNANDRQEYEAHYRIDDLRRRRAGARRQRQGRLCAGVPWQATSSRPRSYRTASRSCAPAPPRFWSQAPIAFSLPAPSWASAAAARGAISHARHSSPPRSKTCAPRSSASASSLLSRSMSWYSPSATPRTTGATAIKSSSNRPSSTVACALACTVSTPAKS